MLLDIETKRQGLLERTQLLQTPGGSLQELLQINPSNKTDQELVNALVNAGRFRNPEGVTAEDNRDALIAYGFTRTEANSTIFDVDANAQLLSDSLKEWDDQLTILLREGRKISGGEVVSKIKQAQWMKAAAQPALALLRPIEWWVSNVVHPIAGLSYHAYISSFRSYDDPAHEYMAKIQKQTAEAGIGTWKHHGILFDQWDTNGFLKFGIEVLADPLTYVGFGLYPRLLKPVPKLYRAATAFERGFLAATDAPFRALRFVWAGDSSGELLATRVIRRQTRLAEGKATVWEDMLPPTFQGIAPRTLMQKGQRHANEAYSLFSKAFAENLGYPILKATPEDVKLWATYAINVAIDAPAGIDPWVKAGKALLGYRALNRVEITELAIKLGLTEDQVTREMIDIVNRTLDDTSGMGISKFLQHEEAVDLIVTNISGRNVNDASRALVSEFLDARRSAIKSQALRPFEDGGTVADQLKNSGGFIRESFVQAARTEVETRRYQQGIIASMLSAFDPYTKLKIISQLDRHVTQRFARSYLMFGAYSVFNVLEASMKTMLGGRNPLWRGSPHQRNVFLYHNIETYLPPGMTQLEGFNLGLGRPEAVLNMVANTVDGRAAPEAADGLNILRKYAEAYNEGRLLPNLGNPDQPSVLAEDLKTILGYNWGNRTTGAQLANFNAREFRAQITKRAPETIAEVTAIIEEVTANFNTTGGLIKHAKDWLLLTSGDAPQPMAHHVAEAYREALFNAVISGDPRLVEEVATKFTIGTVHRGEVERALDDFMLLQTDIKILLAERAEDGSLWARENMAQLNNMFKERIYEHYFTSPEMFNRTFAKLLEDVINQPVQSADQLAAKVALIDDSMDVLDKGMTNTIRAAVSYARTLRNSNNAAKVYDDLWATRITPQLREATDKVDAAVADLMKDLDRIRRLEHPTGGPVLETLPYQEFSTILKALTAKNKSMQTARLAYISKRAEYMVPGGALYQAPGRGRDNAWWAGFLRETKDIWDAHFELRNGLELELLKSKTIIAGAQLRAPNDVTDRLLTRLDIARALGGHPADLERSLYITETNSLKGKNEFVNEILNHVEVAANQHGQTATELGWSPENVGQLYDDIVKKIQVDDVATGVAPIMQELGAAMEKIEALGMNRGVLLTPEGEQMILDAGREITRRIYPGGPASQTIPLGQRLTIIQKVDVAEGPLMLPSGAATLSRQATTVNEVRTLTREAATRLQNTIEEGRTRIRGQKRRQYVSVVNYLDELRRSNIRVTTPSGKLAAYDEVLELHGGRSTQEVTDAWNDVLDSLDTLDLDIDAMVEQAIVDIQNSFVPGTPGAPLVEEGRAIPDVGIAPGVEARLGEKTATHISSIREAISEVENIKTSLQLGDDVSAETIRSRAHQLFTLGTQESDVSRLSTDRIAYALRQPGGRSTITSMFDSLSDDARRYAGVILDRDEPAGPGIRGGVKSFLEGGKAPEGMSLQEYLRATGREQAGRRRHPTMSFDETDPITNEQIVSDRVVASDQMTGRPFRHDPDYPKVEEWPEGFDVSVANRRKSHPLAYIQDADYWQAIREDAAQETNRIRLSTFPDYENQTAVSTTMRMIYPFWGYEAHRWAWWMPREYLRHPGVMNAWGKYQDNTDQGYIHIPGTPLDINPLRGTIFMGGMRRLLQRDYPEYYDTFTGFSEFFDYTSRWGFYPGFPVGLYQSTYGASVGRHHFGDLLPPVASTFLDAVTAIAPDRASIFRDLIFHDNFHDYLIAIEVSRQAEGELGGFNGSEILGKRLENIPLTPEEEAAWVGASRDIAEWQILFEQTGLFRFNPEERMALREAAMGLIEDFTGISRAAQEDMHKAGLRLEDVFNMALHPEAKFALNELEKLKEFSASITLIPSQEGLLRNRVRRFWQLVSEQSETAKEELLVLEDQFRKGLISFDTWQTGQVDKIKQNAIIIETLKASPEFSHVPVSLEERKAEAERSGVKIFIHPLDEVMSLYFSYELEIEPDPETNKLVPNFDKLYTHRRAVLSALSPDHQEQLMARIKRNNTPLEQVRSLVYQNYIRPYNIVSDTVLDTYDPLQRATIRRARDAQGDLRADLRAQTTEAGDLLVAEYESRVATARENLRQTDPQLDAWLLFFGRTTVPQTPQANALFNDLQRRIKTDRGIDSLLHSPDLKGRVGAAVPQRDAITTPN